jgi:hypothetical protein
MFSVARLVDGHDMFVLFQPRQRYAEQALEAKVVAEGHKEVQGRCRGPRGKAKVVAEGHKKSKIVAVGHKEAKVAAEGYTNTYVVAEGYWETKNVFQTYT